MNHYTTEYLESLSTKQLLGLRVGSNAMITKLSNILKEYQETLKNQITYHERLKAILATREHVPNKQEAKAIRQEKAKFKNNR